MRLKIILLFSIFLLTACFDKGASECEALFEDPEQHVISSSFCKEEAQAGDAKGQFLYSQLLFEQGNSQEAMRWLEKAIDQHLPVALLDMAQRYEQGNSVEKSLDKASFYYKKSCEKGVIKGCEWIDIQKKIAQAKKEMEEKERAEQEKKSAQSVSTRIVSKNSEYQPISEEELFQTYNDLFTELDRPGADPMIFIENCYKTSANKLGCFYIDLLMYLVDMSTEYVDSSSPNFDMYESKKRTLLRVFLDPDEIKKRALQVPQFKGLNNTKLERILENTQNALLGYSYKFVEIKQKINK